MLGWAISIEGLLSRECGIVGDRFLVFEVSQSEIKNASYEFLAHYPSSVVPSR